MQKTHRNNRGEKCSHESSWNNFVFSSLRFSFIYWLRKSKSTRRRTSWSWSEVLSDWYAYVEHLLSSIHMKMLIRIGKIILAIALGCSFSFSLWKLIFCLHERYFTDLEAVDTWLEENRLESLKKVFRDHGKCSTMLLCNWEFCLVLQSESPAPILITHCHLTEWEYKYTHTHGDSSGGTADDVTCSLALKLHSKSNNNPECAFIRDRKSEKFQSTSILGGAADDVKKLAFLPSWKLSGSLAKKNLEENAKCSLVGNASQITVIFDT